jgi:hypothetical protein
MNPKLEPVVFVGILLMLLAYTTSALWFIWQFVKDVCRKVRVLWLINS